MPTTTAMLRAVLSDEALTRGLGDEEARVLVEWMADWLDGPHAPAGDGPDAWAAFRRRWDRARALAKFVWLWCHRRARGPAIQLAACEAADWPFPPADVDPAELMQQLVDWEGDGSAIDPAAA